MKQELIIEPKPIKQSVNKSLLKPNNNQTIQLLRDMNKPVLLNNYVELAKNAIFSILAMVVICGSLLALSSDLISKYNTEMNIYRIQVSECRYKFEVNKCEDPVPDVRQNCIEYEKCLL